MSDQLLPTMIPEEEWIPPKPPKKPLRRKPKPKPAPEPQKPQKPRYKSGTIV